MTNNSLPHSGAALRERYDWILFDQGGTLFEPLPGYYSERNQRLAVLELGHQALAQQPHLAAVVRKARVLADAACIDRPFYTHQQLVTEHLLRGLIALDLCDSRQLARFERTNALPEALQRVAMSYFDRQRAAVLSHLRLKPGCHRLLRSLEAFARLAIVSNNADSYLLPLVKRYRIDAFMAAVLSSDALGACKPHPEIFTRAYQHLGIAASARSRVLYVGDSVAFDVAGAQAVGMDVVLLAGAPDGSPKKYEKTSKRTLKTRPEPNYRVANLFELAELFLSPEAVAPVSL